MVAAVRETPAATEERMHLKAIAEGVRLWWSNRDRTWYATSATRKGVSYAVSVDRCSCEGWTKHGYCKHWAMMRAQEAASAADDEPTPTPPPAAPLRLVTRNEGHEDGDQGDEDPGAVLRWLAIQAETAAVNDPDRNRARIGRDLAQLARIFAEAARHADPEQTYVREWIVNAATEAYRQEAGDLEADQAA